jgi:hypothetical protein
VKENGLKQRIKETFLDFIDIQKSLSCDFGIVNKWNGLPPTKNRAINIDILESFPAKNEDPLFSKVHYRNKIVAANVRDGGSGAR